MTKKFFRYFPLLLVGILSLTSCVDELMNTTTDEGTGEEVERTLVLNMVIDNAGENMSRSVNTAAGTNVVINNLWVGAFDAETGTRIGYTTITNKRLTSGTVYEGQIKLQSFVPQGKRKIYIVGIANYTNVYTRNKQSLATYLNSLTSWGQVVDLQIDTESAYNGDKGSDSNASAPFLFGFFQDAVTLNQSPKVDQFRFDENSRRTGMFPSDAESGMTINIETTGANADKDMFVKAGALCLRRLITNVKVEFDSEVIDVRNIKYKRYNMPRVVYLAQRRTDTNPYDDFKQWQRNSPNAADLYLSENDYLGKNQGDPYYCDTEWIPASGNTFEFQHFENKRYGFGDLASHSAREQKNGDFFDALTHYGQYYNDYASYFVINADLTNKKTGERANVTYTIHEGLCNTPDGQPVEDFGYPGDEYYDFAAFRNTNYTYKITVNGFNDIKVHVETEDTPHIGGQEGEITSMIYVTGSRDEFIPFEGATYTNSIQFDANAELGFRLCGVDPKTNKPIDICYNVPDEFFTYFINVWPDKATGAVEIPSLDMLGGASINASLLDAFKINGAVNVRDFVLQYDSSSSSTSSIKTERYTDFDGVRGMKRDYMRALYIFDRNEMKTDAEGCCTLKRIFAAEQVPNLAATEIFQMDINDMIWTYDEYKYPLTNSPHDNIWTSCSNSVVPIKWRHDPGVKGYVLEVFDLNGVSKLLTTINDATPYLVQDSKFGTVFAYNMPTQLIPAVGSDFTHGANNYSLKITPIVDTNMYAGAEPLMIQSSSSGPGIRVCPSAWNFVPPSSGGAKEWNDTNFGFITTAPYTYLRGLLYNSSTTPSITDNGMKFNFPGNPRTGPAFSFIAATNGTLTIDATSTATAANRCYLYIYYYREEDDSYNLLGSFSVYQRLLYPSSSTFTVNIQNIDKPRRICIFPEEPNGSGYLSRYNLTIQNIKFTP